jgi:hypothetical protein
MIISQKVPQNVIATPDLIRGKQSHHQEPIEIMRLLRLFIPRNDRPLHFLRDHQRWEKPKLEKTDVLLG